MTRLRMEMPGGYEPCEGRALGCPGCPACMTIHDVPDEPFIVTDLARWAHPRHRAAAARALRSASRSS